MYPERWGDRMAHGTTAPSFDEMLAATQEIADRWRGERQERQRRRALDPGDFRALADAGFLGVAVPQGEGGFWDGVERSARPLSDVLRTLAAGDPSVALVAAMHPAVVSMWLAPPDQDDPAWAEQRAAVVRTVKEGHQWGTVASEPGSGGDTSKTRTLAEPSSSDAAPLPGRTYRLSGDKHFGSGLGVTSFMYTTGRVEGEDEPATFVIDVRGFDPSSPGAVEVIAPWDGAGMTATQSHGVRLHSVPAVRSAWPRPPRHITLHSGALNMLFFSSVIVGVLDEAVRTARERVAARQGELRAYEQTEWARVDMEHWLARQALEGMIRAIETGDRRAALRDALRGKTALAELAEQVMGRIARVLGGGSYSRHSPFSYWFEDVRALGYLRPPWGMAFDALFEGSLTD